MKKKLSIILSILSMVFIMVALSSCKKDTSLHLSESNYLEYVDKGISEYESYDKNLDIISGSYVAVFGNSDLTDSIYYCANAKVTEKDSETEAETTKDLVIYFVYHINARRPYPVELQTEGEYKTAYSNAEEGVKKEGEGKIAGVIGTF